MNGDVGAEVSLSVRGWLGSRVERRCLHVQGISHWAPCNIGPYSQAVSVGGLLHISGQIALVPGILNMCSQKLTMLWIRIQKELSWNNHT